MVDPEPDADRPPNPEGDLAERIVGPLQAVMLGKVGARDFLAGFARLQEAHCAPVPDWLTEGLIARTAERFRRLHGQWKATPFGATMALRFELARAEAR